MLIYIMQLTFIKLRLLNNNISSFLSTRRNSWFYHTSSNFWLSCSRRFRSNCRLWSYNYWFSYNWLNIFDSIRFWFDYSFGWTLGSNSLWGNNCSCFLLFGFGYWDLRLLFDLLFFFLTLRKSRFGYGLNYSKIFVHSNVLTHISEALFINCVSENDLAWFLSNLLFGFIVRFHAAWSMFTQLTA